MIAIQLAEGQRVGRLGLRSCILPSSLEHALLLSGDGTPEVSTCPRAS